LPIAKPRCLEIDDFEELPFRVGDFFAYLEALADNTSTLRIPTELGRVEQNKVRLCRYKATNFE
jgi:hypothetical protein